MEVPDCTLGKVKAQQLKSTFCSQEINHVGSLALRTCRLGTQSCVLD